MLKKRALSALNGRSLVMQISITVVLIFFTQAFDWFGAWACENRCHRIHVKASINYILNFIFCLYFIDLVFTFLFYHLPFSTFIFLNLSSLAFIVLYFPPLTFIVLHQPPFTFNYNYLPSSVIVELHCLHFGFNISSSHLFYHTLPHCPLSTSFAFIYLHLP